MLFRSIVRAIAWECADHSRYTVYLPIGTPGCPEGKVIEGGNYGTVVDDFADAARCAELLLRQLGQSEVIFCNLQKYSGLGVDQRGNGR